MQSESKKRCQGVGWECGGQQGGSMDNLEEMLNSRREPAWIREGGGDSQSRPGLPGSSQAGCFLPSVTPHPGAGPRQGSEEGQGCGEHHLWQEDKCAGTRGHYRPGCPLRGVRGTWQLPKHGDSFPLWPPPDSVHLTLSKAKPFPSSSSSGRLLQTPIHPMTHTIGALT